MPYTYTEAKKLCEEYQYLVGTLLNGCDAVVECIAVTPFDAQNKQRFFMYYLLFDNDPQAALLQEYKGLLYDVELITRNAEDEIAHEGLFAWIVNNPGVPGIAQNPRGNYAH